MTMLNVGKFGAGWLVRSPLGLCSAAAHVTSRTFVRRGHDASSLMGQEEEESLKYSILIYGSEAAAERLSPEANAALLDGHRALQAALAKRKGFASVQLMPSTSAVSLRAQSPAAKPIVTDGPFADTKEQFLGFYVADFDSLEDAIEMSRMIASPNVTLEIRPVSWTGGTYAS